MHLSTFADPDRVRFFGLLTGTHRPFDGSVVLRGDGGTEWSCTRLGSYVAAVPCDRFQRGRMRLGRLAERLLWHVHYCVRESRHRQVQLPLHHIREVLWEADSFPNNWRSNLLKIIGSLSKIRVGTWPTEGVALRVEETRPLFDDVAIVKSERLIDFEIGGGFLGSLEQFNDGKGGLDWPKDSELRTLRQGNAIQEIYLPAFLGRRKPCDRITPRQKAMLQVILSEVTFERRQKSVAGRNTKRRETEEFVGSDVPDYLGDHQVGCPVLATNSRHVGFNGNGVRRGQGYKLQTWLSRSGYQSVELKSLLMTSNFLERRSELPALQFNIEATVGSHSATSARSLHNSKPEFWNRFASDSTSLPATWTDGTLFLVLRQTKIENRSSHQQTLRSMLSAVWFTTRAYESIVPKSRVRSGSHVNLLVR